MNGTMNITFDMKGNIKDKTLIPFWPTNCRSQKRTANIK